MADDRVVAELERSSPTGPTRSVTNVRWLPPTPANVARALVTIPPGYHQVRSPADQ